MSKVIVVGIDGSETAKKAAKSARQMAIALETTLHIVTAFNDETTVVFGTGSDQSVVSSQEKAEKIARNLAVELSSGELKVGYFAVRGTPAHALLQHAEKYNARMIVVGNKRMQGLGRVLGSVASNVAHNAPCDVYIAKTYS